MDRANMRAGMGTRSLIRTIDAERNRLHVVTERAFHSAYLREDFVAEYDADIDLGKLDPSIVPVPYLLNIIPVIWLSGETFRIDSMDADLRSALVRIREVFRRMYPEAEWSGDLVPERTIRTNAPAASGRMGLLFSGGVDATYASLMQRATEQVLITIWGGDISLDNPSRWEACRRECQAFAARHGHASRVVKSNLHSFLQEWRLRELSPAIGDWWTHVQHGMGLVGLSAPILGHEQIHALCIASSDPGHYGLRWGSHPDIDNEIRWAGVRVFEHGTDMTRQEKLRGLHALCRDTAVEKPNVRVCTSLHARKANCCRCEKCLRTIMGLLAVGADPREYGFPISSGRALRRVRWLLYTHRLPDLGGRIVRIWGDIQAAATAHRETLTSGRSLRWFLDFDLQKYGDRRQRLLRLRSSVSLFVRRVPVLYSSLRRIRRRVFMKRTWIR